MPSNYKTPGVYVEEKSTLPPSIAEVSTAVPAFVGYTEKAEKNGVTLKNVPIRITSLLEFRTYFGEPDRMKFTVSVNETGNITSVIEDPLDNQNNLYYALDLYFKNGGSDCYIVSVGAFGEKSKEDFAAGIDALAKEDEPTLIVISEAATLDDDVYYGLCQQALLQCATLADRFCILDVLRDDVNGQGFKGEQGIGMQNLKYGAAYYPYLNTSLNYIFKDEDVTVSGLRSSSGNANNNTPAKENATFSKEINGLKVTYLGSVGDQPKVEILAGTGTRKVAFSVTNGRLSIANVGANGKIATEIFDAWTEFTDKGSFSIEATGDGGTLVTAIEADLVSPGPKSSPQNEADSVTLLAIKESNTSIYNSIKQELAKRKVVLPPSPAVAGVYATTDRERGVWKAPANVGLNAVISPVVKVTASDQDRLNIDENGGKSINAIRSFFGKGTLVWGARTLAGNDNEWRYVPVRRLFNMIEESSKKASYFAVFEPNDATTWLKVKGMIESYLYGLWQQGALAGSTPKAAYYVNVGLGTTMTQQDILEGRMIIEIGIAAVRPAEFVVLRFSHKLQEA